jgi:hypothetical protein
MSAVLDWKTLSKDEKFGIVRKLAEVDGLSGGQIAGQFVNASRNSVLSFVDRYDIKLARKHGQHEVVRVKTTPATTVRKGSSPAGKFAFGRTHAPPAKPVPDIVALAPISKSRAFDPIDGVDPVHLDSLTGRQCHWPVSGLEGNEPLFCGASASNIYCTSHERLAYVPRGQRGSI